MGIRGCGVLTIMLIAAGCATGGMIPGNIYSTGGKILQFEIEKAHRTGAVKALDPATGEKFVGAYSSVKEVVSGSSSAFVSGKAGFASGFGSASAASNIANATAFLKGDRGTMLNCSMLIQAGFSPSGIGDCTDNRGEKYKLQF
jgi:hypothetical protein